MLQAMMRRATPEDQDQSANRISPAFRLGIACGHCISVVECIQLLRIPSCIQPLTCHVSQTNVHARRWMGLQCRKRAQGDEHLNLYRVSQRSRIVFAGG